MRIVLYIPQLHKGGPDRVFYQLLKGFSTLGVETILVVNKSGGYFWDLLPANIERISLESESQKKYPAKAFGQTISALKPSIVLCTLNSILTATLAKMFYWKTEAILVIRPANHMSINAVQLLKSSPLKHSISFALNILSLHVANFVICQSQDLYNDFRKFKVSKNKLTIIGNPIDLPEKINDKSRSSEPLKLIAVGRLGHQKGFDYLIEAIDITNKWGLKVTLEILGEGELRQELQSMIDTKALNHSIRLLGNIDQIEPYLLNSDYLISSSRYEGFPNVVLEALSYGLPVLAANCPGGTSAMVLEGKTGFLCKPNSPLELAQMIKKANQSKPFDSRVIREFVQQNFENSIISEKYISTFEKMINK